MKKVLFVSLALAGVFLVSKSSAVSFNDIQFWIGSGTNRAGLVIEWSTPESFGYTTVPAPIADKSLVWGYRFNGTATGAQMFNAIVAADPRLYAVEAFYAGYGTERLRHRFPSCRRRRPRHHRRHHHQFFHPRFADERNRLH